MLPSSKLACKNGTSAGTIRTFSVTTVGSSATCSAEFSESAIRALLFDLVRIPEFEIGDPARESIELAKSCIAGERNIRDVFLLERKKV